MPRIKQIYNNRQVKFSDICISDVSDNKCVGAEIIISGLDERMWYILENFYKVTIVKNNESFSIKFKNSWKGLIELLLAIFYCLVGGKIVRLQCDYHFSKHVRVDGDFNLLKSTGKQMIEKLYIPPSFKPLYVYSAYSDKNVDNTIKTICEAFTGEKFGIDIKKSKVTIEASNEIRKDYQFRQINEKINYNDLICSVLNDCTNRSVAFVSSETMKILFQNHRVLIAHPIKKPIEVKDFNENVVDCTYPNLFLAYPILKKYEGYLASYFPLYRSSIKRYAKETDENELGVDSDTYIELGCKFIITDFMSLGKWG